MKPCQSVATICVLTILIFNTLGCSRKKDTFFQPQQPKPGSAEQLSNEGMTFLTNGDLIQARNRFQAALATAPNNIDAILGIGLIHLNNQEFEQSLASFERLKQLTPQSYDVYNYLGIIYLELQQYALAREHLLVAATADKYETPENAFANLAILEMKQNNNEAAMRYIKKGMEKKKNFTQLHVLEGRVHESQKNWQGALIAYERASAISYNNDPGILLQIARMHKQLGDKNKALDILESSLGKTRSEDERQAVISLIAEINSGR